MKIFFSFVSVMILALGACSEDYNSGSAQIDTLEFGVSFVSPQEGTSVSGLVDVEVEVVSSNPATVALSLNGEPLAELGQEPFTFAWDTSDMVVGPYVLKATATDASGNSSDAVVTLFVESCDVRNTCPELGGLVFVSPQAGDVVGGLVEVVVEPEGAGSVDEVVFSVAGEVVGTSSSAPHAITWDTEGLDGDVAVRAAASDGEASARISVFVDNAPPVVVLGEVDEVVADGLSFAATISDNSGIFEARISVAGTEIDEAIADSFEGTLDVSALSAGQYTLVASAEDGLGQSAEDARDFVVDRPPSLSFTSPSGAQTIRGTVTVGVEADDDVGLDRVGLYMDGELLGDFDEEGRFLWTPPQGQRSVVLEAVAVDTRGQETAAQVEVEVDSSFPLRLQKCTNVCTDLVAGDRLNGDVVLRARADETLLDAVEFFAGGEGLGTAERVPFDVSMETLDFDEGSILIRAVATATDDRVSEVEVEVLINNCDRDNDGVISAGCAGPDCDDLNPDAFPGAEDREGDDVDQNCDGLDGVDSDEDGFASTDSGGRDCDDGDPEIFPCPSDPVGLCSDRVSDRFNCGECGRVCDSAFTCVEAQCVCIGDDCQEGEPEDYDFDVPATFYDRLEIVTVRSEGVDVDNDGDVDNSFGPMLGQLGNLLGADVNEQLELLVRSGQLALGSTWPTLELPDVEEATAVDVHFFDLVDVDNNPNTNDAYLASRGAFLQGFVTPRTRFEDGVIEDRILSVGPNDNFQILVPFGDLPVQLIVDRAVFAGGVSQDGDGIRLQDGTLAGVVKLESLVTGLNRFLQSEACSCLGLDEPLIDLLSGEGPEACVGEFDSGTCEFQGQELCGQLADACGLLMLLLPGQTDIDTNDDGRADAYSVFIRLEGRGTDIQGVVP